MFDDEFISRNALASGFQGRSEPDASAFRLICWVCFRIASKKAASPQKGKAAMNRRTPKEESCRTLIPPDWLALAVWN